MAYDMTNSIMDAIVADFPYYLNEGLLRSHPDYLETIEKGPLQDDPTQRATYLVVEPDHDMDEEGYRMPVGASKRWRAVPNGTQPLYEVGGDFLMVNYFKVGGWTPQAVNKAECYEIAGKFSRRLERCIQVFARNEFANGVTTDDDGETTAGLLQVFNLHGTSFRLVGGESEWYAKVYVRFAVYSKVRNSYWS